jgi:hypothetical protein
LASSHQQQDPVDLLDRAALDKHAKYDDLASQHRGIFIPVVVSPYGLMQRDVLNFTAACSSDLPAALRRTAKRAFTIALAQSTFIGNARILIAARRRILGAFQDAFVSVAGCLGTGEIGIEDGGDGVGMGGES